MTQHLQVRPCPICGDGVLPQATYCSACGARLRGAARRAPTVGAVIGAVILILVALPLGLVGGGCAVLAIGVGPSADVFPFALIGLVLLGAAIGCCLAAGRVLSGR